MLATDVPLQPAAPRDLVNPAGAEMTCETSEPHGVFGLASRSHPLPADVTMSTEPVTSYRTRLVTLQGGEPGLALRPFQLSDIPWV